MGRQTWVAAAALAAALAPAAAAADFTVKVSGATPGQPLKFDYVDRPKDKQNVPLALNDVVTITLRQTANNGGPILLGEWHAVETWQESKKRGKDTIITTYHLPHQAPVLGTLGTQIKITANFSGAAEDFELSAATNPTRKAQDRRSLTFIGSVGSAGATPLRPTRGNWEQPPKFTPKPTPGDWFIITVKVVRTPAPAVAPPTTPGR
jgi:hypothetical protein